MLTVFRRRALGAVIALLLLISLCGCGAAPTAPAETPAPTPLPRPETGGCWVGSFNATDELLRELGADLGPWLKAPLAGFLQLDIGSDGRCVLRGTYTSCAEPLRAALTEFVRDLQQQESDETLTGLKLAEALGGDPSAVAGALCDELLPPPFTLTGRLADGGRTVNWDGGGSSSLNEEDGGLRITLPGRGELFLRPQGQA